MIDLRTLLAVLLVADLLLASLLWIGAGKKVREDLALWSFSLVAQALAFALFAARGQPQAGIVVLGATLLGISLTMQAASLLSFGQRHLPVWVHTGVMAGVAAPFALMANESGLATFFGGVVFGTLLAMLAAISWQLRPSSAAARGVLVGSYVVAGAAFVILGLTAAWSADPTRVFLAPTHFESALYLALHAAVLASTFGFVLLQMDRSETSVKRLAAMDQLTGTHNRLTFDEIAERELSRARRSDQPFSLILVEIDGFVDLANRHGERFIEPVLRRFAQIVRAALRKEDVIVHFEHGQFLLMLPAVPGPGAVVVAGRIRRELEEEAFEIDGERVPVTVSAGVSARLDEGPESVASLLARADEALALAKRRGRNRVVALSLGRSNAA